MKQIISTLSHPAGQILSAPQGKKETVRLVEDDASILDMTSTMLDTLGYQVTSTANPEEGVELANKIGAVLEG